MFNKPISNQNELTRRSALLSPPAPPSVRRSVHPLVTPSVRRPWVRIPVRLPRVCRIRVETVFGSQSPLLVDGGTLLTCRRGIMAVPQFRSRSRSLSRSPRDFSPGTGQKSELNFQNSQLERQENQAKPNQTETNRTEPNWKRNEAGRNSYGSNVNKQKSSQRWCHLMVQVHSKKWNYCGY